MERDDEKWWEGEVEGEKGRRRKKEKGGKGAKGGEEAKTEMERETKWEIETEQEITIERENSDAQQRKRKTADNTNKNYRRKKTFTMTYVSHGITSR